MQPNLIIMLMALQVRLVLMSVFGPQNIVVAVIVSARMGYLALNTVGSSQNLIRKLTTFKGTSPVHCTCVHTHSNSQVPIALNFQAVRTSYVS